MGAPLGIHSKTRFTEVDNLLVPKKTDSLGQEWVHIQLCDLEGVGGGENPISVHAESHMLL